MKSKTIPILVAIIVVVAAAAGYTGYSFGTVAGQTQGSSGQGGFGAGGGMPGGFSGGMPGGGQGGFPGAGGGQYGGGQTGSRQAGGSSFTVGQVKQVDGSTIQLTTMDNQVVTVKVSDSTQIQKASTGSVADLKTGDRISVQGTRGTDGTFTATSVQVGGTMMGGPGMGASQSGTPRPGSTPAAGSSN